MTIDIDKILAEIKPALWIAYKNGYPSYYEIMPVGLSREYTAAEPLLTLSQARALAERVMAEQREIDAKICDNLDETYDEICISLQCAEAIRNQQPTV